MELLERASQLKVLRSVLDRVEEGQGCITLVYGEAGIGKTSLVEYFLGEHQTDWRIMQGACDPLSTPRPLGPLHDIAFQTQGALIELFESGSRHTEIFSVRLHELQERSTILVIEDIHWADEATLDLLKYLGRRIRQTVSLMILTYRDDEIGLGHPLRTLLGDLPSSRAVYRIPISPLSKEAVRELAKNKKIDSLELHRLTNGNPFFVTEVLAVEGGIPETVRDAVLARAARLSAAARNVLEIAAVIGSRVEPWLLSNTAGSRPVDIEECVTGGMLQVQSEYYAFRHELARQTILESISPQRKIVLHRLVLNALCEFPGTQNDPARLANHAEGTKDGMTLLGYAPAAARQASVLGAHRQAAAHYKSALQYADLISIEKHAEILDAYADECDLSDQMIEADQAQQEALRLWQMLGRRDKEGGAFCRLSEMAIKLNRKADIERYVGEAIRILETLPPSRELARAYSHKSRLHMVAGQSIEALYSGQRAMELAEQLEDVETLVHALCNIGVEQVTDHPAEGLAKLNRVLQLAIEHGLHNHAGRIYYNLVGGTKYLRDFTASLCWLNEGIAYCAQHDIDYWRLGLLGLRARFYFMQSKWAEAEKDIQAAQEFWGTMETRSIVEPVLLHLQIRRGEPISPEAIVAARELERATIMYDVHHVVAVLFAEAAWLRGDLEQCLSEVKPIFEIACRNAEPNRIGELAYWMWRAGAITQPPPNCATPYATQISGNWREAAAMWEKFGCPYEQAMALMDGDEAAQLAALEIFESLGAQPAVEKIKGQMRAQGIRVPRGPRPATRRNPFGLTSREMEVLSSLTQGSSNSSIAEQLSLSTRTVEHHIASILQKMEVQSRNEAVVLALKNGMFSSTQGI